MSRCVFRVSELSAKTWNKIISVNLLSLPMLTIIINFTSETRSSWVSSKGPFGWGWQTQRRRGRGNGLMVRLWPKGAVFLSLTWSPWSPTGKVLLVAHVVVFYPLKSFRVLFSYWDNGEPNSYGGHDEDCVEMKGHKQPNAWNDADCQTRNFWVCEKMVTLWLLAKLNFTSTDESLWENVTE